MTRPIISPGQGLLLLMKHYINDLDKMHSLKKLYLSGALDTSEQEKIKNLLKDPVLAEYQISYEPKVINEDPTRRYFETHLSYESLKHGLDKIHIDELTSHTDALIKMLPPDKASGIMHVLNGDVRTSDDNLQKEYADYISKIKSGKIFEQLSPENRKKIELIVKSSFLGVINAWYTPMPLDIYGTGFYNEAHKGKKMVEGQETTRNQHLGLMKGQMPLPFDDLARGDQAIPLLKPSDQATFIEHAAWPKMNFNKMVHPFSNSISGTMLCQLRSIAKLRNDGNDSITTSSQKMSEYGKLFTSAMLFGSGGHTLNEFTAPFSLPETKREFKTTPRFSEITLESMFLSGNEAGFDSALKDTISYNAIVLQKQQLHAQIRGETSLDPRNKALKHLKTNQVPQPLISDIITAKDNYALRIRSQDFSQIRSGHSKNQIIQTRLADVLDNLKRGDFTSAIGRCISLKQEISSTFGTTNFWGQKSESYKLIESIEKSINKYHKDKLAIIDKFRSLRPTNIMAEKKAEANEEKKGPLKP